MRIFHILFTVTLLASCGLWADPESAPAEPDKPPAPAGAVMPEIIRDPFWPVGYLPPSLIPEPEDAPAAQEATAIQVLDEARGRAFAALKVGGIIRHGNRYFATVNAQMVRAGDVMVVPMDGHVFRFLIRNITMRKVQIEPLE